MRVCIYIYIFIKFVYTCDMIYDRLILVMLELHIPVCRFWLSQYDWNRSIFMISLTSCQFYIHGWFIFVYWCFLFYKYCDSFHTADVYHCRCPKITNRNFQNYLIICFSTLQLISAFSIWKVSYQMYKGNLYFYAHSKTNNLMKLPFLAR